MKDWANKLPDDAYVIFQVIGSETHFAWSMYANLSDELANVKWSYPAYAVSLYHPDLKDVSKGFGSLSFIKKINPVEAELTRDWYQCSGCGCEDILEGFRYCPNCGGEFNCN